MFLDDLIYKFSVAALQRVHESFMLVSRLFVSVRSDKIIDSKPLDVSPYVLKYLQQRLIAGPGTDEPVELIVLGEIPFDLLISMVIVHFANQPAQLLDFLLIQILSRPN